MGDARFWNNQVMNDMESVLRAIIQAMETLRHGFATQRGA